MTQLRPTFGRAVTLAALSLALAVGSLSAQATGTIAGQVTDSQSGRPLSEAQVSIPGTGIGTLSNSSGRYILLNVPAGPVTVRVELIGFGTTTQQVNVGAGQSVSLDFQLGQTAISLDELVVTGVGQATERRALGTTVDVLSAQAIETAPVGSVQQLLQGRVAGATVILRTRSSRLIWPSCTRRRLTGSMVSTPITPNSAWAMGSRLLSWSWGEWSLAMTSMVPSTSPSTTAMRSASLRRGGLTLAKVR